MKKFGIIFFVCFVLSSCVNNDFSIDKGIITGPDLRKCACCGGWFISINDVNYRFYNLPAGCTIDLENSALPMDVKIKWHKDTNSCSTDLIIPDKITKY